MYVWENTSKVLKVLEIFKYNRKLDKNSKKFNYI